MDSAIAFCGLDCAACPAFHAAERLSMEERQRVAETWTAEYGASFTAEQIDCVGCSVAAGVHAPYCAVCAIRLCAGDRSVTTCAACPEFACEKLVAFFPSAPEARATLEALRLA